MFLCWLYTKARKGGYIQGHYIEKGYRREKGYLLLTLYTDASKGG